MPSGRTSSVTCFFGVWDVESTVGYSRMVTSFEVGVNLCSDGVRADAYLEFAGFVG